MAFLLNNGNRAKDLGEFFIIITEDSIELIIIGGVEKREPLLVRVVVFGFRVEQVLANVQVDTAEELLIMSVLHDDSHTLKGFDSP